MNVPAPRPWQTEICRSRIASIRSDLPRDSAALAARIDDLTDRNAAIHGRDCINLNPATNVMNPAAEALLARGLGSRPSLGDPGDKYEMGLEAIEEIEVIAHDLACAVFNARHAEIRVASGAMANLTVFMAMATPGDAVIVPPAEIGGHVTHHRPGAAGLYGLAIHHATPQHQYYSVDVDALARQAREVRPRLITLGGSLNLEPHPVAAVREIADDVGAILMFDAAHLCGMIAGGTWANPLDLGAHVMTMSTYKSLGGPAGGLIVTNDSTIAERLDRVAFPGLTANFDVAKSAALALSLLDWQEHGAAYAHEMVRSARALAANLMVEGIKPFLPFETCTRSHQFALEAARWGGGHTMAKRLRRANILSSAIGTTLPTVDGDANGLRLGTPEIVRIGMVETDMPELAHLIARALKDVPENAAREVSALRARFDGVHFVRPSAGSAMDAVT